MNVFELTPTLANPINPAIAFEFVCPIRQGCLNQGLIESMNVDTGVIQPSLNPMLSPLSEYAPTGLSDPFCETDAACVNQGNH